MSNQIFDTVPEEDYIVEPLDINSANHVDGVIALDKHMRGVEAAFESIDTLSRIQGLLSGQKERNENATQGIKLAKIASENISKRLNMESNGSILAIEDLSPSEALVVALESIGSFLKSIWDAIVRACKYVWKTLCKFFNPDDKKKKKADILNTAEGIKELTKKVKEGKVLDLKPTDLTNTDISQFFHYTGAKLKDEDFFKMVENQINRLTLLKEGISEIVIANKLIKTVMTNFSDSSLDDEAFYKCAAALITSCENYRNFTQQKLPKADIKGSDIEDLFESKGTKRQDVKSDTIHALTGYIKGVTFYFYELNEENSHIHIFKVADEHGPKRCTFKALDLTNLALFNAKTLEANTACGEVTDLYNDNLAGIVHDQQHIIEIIDTIKTHLESNGRTDQAQKIITRVKSTITMLIEMITMLRTIVEAENFTLGIYSKYCEISLDSYTSKNK